MNIMRTSILALILTLGITPGFSAGNDGMDPFWKSLHGIADFDGASDPDNDGRINIVESLNFSDPHAVDTGLGVVFIRDIEPVDGMDDYWQERYAIGTNQALHDPDGDGRKNIEESIVGSHPFQADPPWGMSNGLPDRGPESMTVSLAMTTPGVRYLLQYSNDMIIWQNASGFSNPFWGSGSEFSQTLNTGYATRQFYRFVLDQPDTDSDGLLDWAETRLGTNPYSIDSDGDGQNDLDEIAAGWNPNDNGSNGGAASQRGLETGLVEQPWFWQGKFKYLIDSHIKYSDDDIPSEGWIMAYDSAGFFVDDDYDDDASRAGATWSSLLYGGTFENGVGPFGQISSWTKEEDDFIQKFVEMEHNEVRIASNNSQPWEVKKRFLAIESTMRYDEDNIPTFEYPGTHSSLGFVTFTIPPGSKHSASHSFEPLRLSNAFKEVDLYEIEAWPRNAHLGLDNTVYPPWLMLPLGETVPMQLSSFGRSYDYGTFLFYQANGGGVQPAVHAVISNYGTVYNNSDKVSFSSSTAGDGGNLKVGLGSYEPEPVLRFAVLPRRTLKVAVHPIALLSPTGQVIAAPNQLPTAASIQSYLNLVYGTQANVYAQVTVSPTTSLNWDIGVSQSQGTYGQGDKTFAVCYNPPGGIATSLEEAAVIAAVHNNTADLNVYWIAAPEQDYYSGIRLYDRLDQPPEWFLNSSALGFAGKATKENQGIVFVWQYPLSWVHGVSGQTRYRPSYIWSIAHEIGHALGLSHSDLSSIYNGQESFLGHIPNSDNEMRLMTGLEGPKRASNPTKLVKPEWIKIQQYFGE